MGKSLRHSYSINSLIHTDSGELKIAEVESRIQNLDLFIKGIAKFGFKLSKKETSYKMFVMIEFVKLGAKHKLSHAEINHSEKRISLNPCVYKKR